MQHLLRFLSQSRRRRFILVAGFITAITASLFALSSRTKSVMALRNDGDTARSDAVFVSNLAVPPPIANIAQAKSEGINSWTSNGPGPTIYTIAIDARTPNIIYAGTKVGVYKSTDGVTWGAINTGLDGSGAAGIAIDPQTPSTIYAVGNGIYKSTNSGSSWSAINSGLPTTSTGRPIGVYTIAIDPQNPNILYVGTGQFGLYKSTTGGANWVSINNGIPSRSFGVDIVALAIDPKNPNTLYAGTVFGGDKGGIYKSANGGESWSQINNGLTSNTAVTAIAIDPQNPGTLYAAAGTITLPPFGNVYKSTNGGESWTTVSNGLPSNLAYALASAF